MTLLQITYTTEAAMQRYFSASGTLAFSDHDGDAIEDDGVIDDCINQATEEIDGYARQRYSQAGLSASTLINRWATTIACFFLCLRRGNAPPESLQMEYDRLLAQPNGLLPLIAAGKYSLPGVALIADLRPTWSNLRIDRRWPNSKVRVTRSNSSEAPSTLSQDDAIDIVPFDG